MIRLGRVRSPEAFLRLYARHPAAWLVLKPSRLGGWVVWQRVTL